MKTTTIDRVTRKAMMYHGTSKEAAAIIEKNNGFVPGGEKGLKDLAGFDIEPGRPISLSDKATASKYVYPRPEGTEGKLLAFDISNLKIALAEDLRRIDATDFEGRPTLIPKLRKFGFDGYFTSSPHDELFEIIVINPEKLKLVS